VVRIILLLSPSPVSKLDRRHSRRLRKRDNVFTGALEGWWEGFQIIRPQESLVLYESFNTLWTSPIMKKIHNIEKEEKRRGTSIDNKEK
jgi:hypothetical protein